MTTEEQHDYDVGEAYESMSKTEGWILFEKNIRKQIDAVKHYMLNDMKPETAANEILEVRGKLAAYNDILGAFESFVKFYLEKSEEKKEA